MKRSQSVQLSLLATVSAALAGCGEDYQQISLDKTFHDASECVAARFPKDMCSHAHTTAYQRHSQIKPRYVEQSACDAAFVAGACEQNSDQYYSPRFYGFRLLALDEVTDREYRGMVNVASAELPLTEIIEGVVIGHMDNQQYVPRYQVAPVYPVLDRQGQQQERTLSDRNASGDTFATAAMPPDVQDWVSYAEQQTERGGFGGGGGSAARSYHSSDYRSSTRRSGFRWSFGG